MFSSARSGSRPGECLLERLAERVDDLADRDLHEWTAEALGQPARIRARALRGVARGHRDAVHVLRSECLRREGRGHRGVDPSRHAHHHFPEAVLADVVPEPELEGTSHLLDLVDERDHLADCLVAVAGWPRRADVDDLDRRDLLAFTRKGAAAHVAQTAADHFLRLDVDDKQRFLETGCACQHVPFVVEHARVSVENQLVLSADRVAERDEARVVPRARHEHLLALFGASHVERRCRDVDEQLCSAQCEIGRGRARLPHVFAHGQADEGLAVLEQNQVTARREVAVFVEDAVVRQEALPVHRLDLTRGTHVTGVVEIAIEVRRAHENRRASCLARDLLHGVLCRTDEPGAEQEVLRRIAGHRELREHDEVGGVLLGLGEALEDQLPVPVEIADDRVDLGQCEPHGLSLAVSASQSKTKRPRSSGVGRTASPRGRHRRDRTCGRARTRFRGLASGVPAGSGDAAAS